MMLPPLSSAMPSGPWNFARLPVPSANPELEPATVVTMPFWMRRMRLLL